MLGVSLVMLTVIVVPIRIGWWWPIHVVRRWRRVVVMCTRIGCPGMLWHGVHGWGRRHVHFRVNWVSVVVIHVWRFHFFFLLLLFRILYWIHAIVFVGLSFVVELLVVAQLLPGRSYQARNAAPLRRNTAFGLLETKHMRTEKHIISCLVALAIGLFVGRLVLRHLFFIALAIFLGPVFVDLERRE